jgi:hypothetical protein
LDWDAVETVADTRGYGLLLDEPPRLKPAQKRTVRRAG